MLSNKRVFLGLIVLVAVALATLGFNNSVAGQSSRSDATGPSAPQGEAMIRLSTPVKAAPALAEAVPVGAAFEAAANENAALKTGLDWVFGGKSQRGWAIYTPLIATVIGAEESAAPSLFAMRLSRWQKERGLEPHGVLESATWSRMVSMFQSVRLKQRAYPSAEGLVTAPASDCYDPSRAEELRKVERETYQAYKRMISAAAADPSLGLKLTANGELAPGEKYLKIISAYRSREYQEQLRKKSPHSGRAGLAVNSPHFTGRALDIYVGGEPVSTKDDNRALQTQTPVYRWLVRNAHRFGFKPYFYEPWHWEYVPQS